MGAGVVGHMLVLAFTTEEIVEREGEGSRGLAPGHLVVEEDAQGVQSHMMDVTNVVQVSGIELCCLPHAGKCI